MIETIFDFFFKIPFEDRSSYVIDINQQFDNTNFFAIYLISIALAFFFWRLSKAVQHNQATTLKGVRIISLSMFIGLIYVSLSKLLTITTVIYNNSVENLYFLPKNFDSPSDFHFDFYLYSLSGLILGFFLSKFVASRLEPLLSDLFTEQKDRQNGLSDIRDLTFSKIKKFAPEKEFSKSIKQEMIFLAKSAQGKIEISVPEFKELNFQIIGTPGAGKGVIAQNIGIQCILNKIKFIVFDPKDDEWLQKTLVDRCGEKLHLIDLSKAIPQINIFSGLSKAQCRDLLVEAFGLKEKGVESDVYSTEEQANITEIFESLEDKNIVFQNVIEKFQLLDEPPRKTIARLKNILAALSLNGSTSLQKLLVNKKIESIYVKFSQTSDTEKLMARLIFLSMMAHRKSQKPEEQKNHHLTLFCDEFKHLTNQSTISAIEMMRSHSVNFLIAHQSLGNFKGDFSDITGESALEGIMDSCAAKIIYKQRNPDHADFWSRSTGKINYSSISNTFQQNESAKGIFVAEGKKETLQRNLIEFNEFISLPKEHAVFLGIGLAQVGLVQKQCTPIDTPYPQIQTSLSGSQKINCQPNDIATPSHNSDTGWEV